MSRRAEIGKTDLYTTHSELAKEWHPLLNGNLSPSDVTAGSNRMVYWKCTTCDYVWEAKVCNRAILGRGCPCCANKVTVADINSLAKTHPEISEEWYQPLNGDVTPYDVTHGSGKKYWWKCPRGHIYQATVLHRTYGAGTKCPICNSGRQTSFAEQALYYYIKKVFPTAINGYKDIFTKSMELDIYIPEEKLGIEYDGVYWHHRKAATYERESRKYDICKENGIKLLRIREQKKEEENPPADECIFLPNDGTDEESLVYAIKSSLKWLYANCGNKSAYSKGKLPRINLKKDKFDILSYLQGPVKNSVQEVAPELVDDWDYKKNGDLKPDMISAGSSQSVNWICHTCGYEWEAPVYHRAKSHTGCPKCLGLVFEKGTNDLKTKNPELLLDWDYETNSANNIIFPDEIMFNSGKPVNWICHTCGYKWAIPLRNRTVDGSGCIQCGYKAGWKTKQQKLLEEQGCLTDPLLLSEWDYEKNAEIGLYPNEVTPGCGKSAYWTCSKCHYKWKAPIARRSKGAGCRKCADKANPDLKRKRLIEQGRALTNKLLLEEWDYEANDKTPQEYTFGSKVKAHWICSKCGYKWAAAIHARNKGAGCPACAGNILVPGRNDLATVKPELAKEWDYEKNIDINPSQISYSSKNKYWWKCTKGHASYLADPAHRSNGTGCPLCAKEIMSEKASKPIDQLTLNGEFIRTFKSAKSAGAELGINSSGIGNAIRKGATSGGYRWRHHIEK